MIIIEVSNFKKHSYRGIRSKCCLDFDIDDNVTKLKEAKRSPLAKGFNKSSSENDSALVLPRKRQINMKFLIIFNFFGFLVFFFYKDDVNKRYQNFFGLITPIIFKKRHSKAINELFCKNLVTMIFCKQKI